MRLNTKVIKEAMFINGWTVKSLTEKTGLSRATVSKAIHGVEISPLSISKLYNATEIDLNLLVDWGDKDE